MAHRAAGRRMLREAECYANDPESFWPERLGGNAGFEMASGTVSCTPALPSDLCIGDVIVFAVDGEEYYRTDADD